MSCGTFGGRENNKLNLADLRSWAVGGGASTTQMDILMIGVKYFTIKVETGVAEQGSISHSKAVLKSKENLLKWMAAKFCAIKGLWSNPE